MLQLYCVQSEIHEEVITSSTVTSSMSKNSSKTKKKKIEGVAGNDASQISTPRTKKTKKSKKSELEKENISVVSFYFYHCNPKYIVNIFSHLTPLKILATRL